MRLALAALVAVVGMSLSSSKGQDYEKLLKAAKFTLAESVDMALKEAKDGTAVAVEIENEDGHDQFSCDVAQGDKVLEVNLDIVTGKLINTGQEKEDKSKLVRALKIKLTDAIAAALKKQKGSAVEAKFSLNKEEKPEAEVRVFNEGKLFVVMINGENGDVISVKEKEKKKEGMGKDDDDD